MKKNSEWKEKFNGMFNICQKELKKTTDIGKKMISASKTNSDLRDAYEELGELVYEKMVAESTFWTNEDALKIKSKIELCHENLDDIEGEVNKIKFDSNN